MPSSIHAGPIHGQHKPARAAAHLLAALRRRRHRGAIAGLDLSPGMAREAAGHAPAGVADAQALPLRTAAADLALSPHMLYHVPDIPAAIAELRWVVRPGARWR